MGTFDPTTVFEAAVLLISLTLAVASWWTLRKTRAIVRELHDYIADTQWRRAMEQDLVSFFKKEAFRQGFRDGLENSRPS